MLKYCFILFYLLFFSFRSVGQLNSGELMFVGYNADLNDGFAIVVLADVPANTTIYFTDNEWNGSAIGAGGAFNSASEGEMTWATGASIILAGTVITFNETKSSGNAGYGATIGSISGTIDLNASNEVFYAFLGTDNITPTSFLSAITNDGFNVANGQLTNTGLTSGTNATSISGDEDIMVYSGSTVCNTTITACAAAIANSTNWSTEDGTGDQSTDGSFPDFPTDVPASFSGSALPVELVSFNAILNNNKVDLTWVTASEINNDYFEIEKSTDAKTFNYVSTVYGNGNSNQMIEYSDVDYDLMEGISYYRLKQVDYDGAISYFDIVSVKYDPTSVQRNINLLLNPVLTSQSIKIEIGGFKNNNIVLTLRDITGKEFYTKTKLIENNYQLETINLDDSIPRGYYLVTASSNNKIISKKLIIQ